MKRKFFAAIVLTLSLMLIFCISSSAAIAGDINADGKPDINDARSALRIAIKLNTEDEFSSEQLDIADYDDNGVIDINDARAILRVAIQLEPEMHYFGKTVLTESGCEYGGQILYRCSETGCTEHKAYIKDTDPLGHELDEGEVTVLPTCTENGEAVKKCIRCEYSETDIIPAAHTWVEATCIEVRHCSVCGVTEGETGEHTWVEATCVEPKHCSVCGVTEGETGEHTWVEATCVETKHCTVCGVTEGETGEHTWVEATCVEPKHCSVCGVTEGETGEHTWVEATCIEPKHCSVCGITEGETGEHTWIDATCIEPKKCSLCGVTEGETGEHTWVEATCIKPKFCSLCGITEGETSEHTWVEATCIEPKKCSLCGVTEGETAPHSTQIGYCEYCGNYIDTLQDKANKIKSYLNNGHNSLTSAYALMESASKEDFEELFFQKCTESRKNYLNAYNSYFYNAYLECGSEKDFAESKVIIEDILDLISAIYSELKDINAENRIDAFVKIDGLMKQVTEKEYQLRDQTRKWKETK